MKETSDVARPKKTPEAPKPSVNADDFLAELEASDEALTLDEDEEVVTEDDIMAELSEGGDTPPHKHEDTPAPDVQSYNGLLPSTGSLLPMLESLDSKLDSLQDSHASLAGRLDGIASEQTKRQEVIAKALTETLTKVHNLTTLLGALEDSVKKLQAIPEPEAAPRPKPVPKADTFVDRSPPKTTSAVDTYMLKEIKEIVSAFNPGFKADVTRMAKVIHSKRFAGDPSALPKVEVLCREHLGDLGVVKNGLFIRHGGDEDIEL